MRYVLLAPSGTPGLLRKVAAFVAAVVLAGLVLMFSAVLLVILAVVGVSAWAYFWWKTRELRRQMREFPPRDAAQDVRQEGGEVFEGEVIRVNVSAREEERP